MSTKHYIDLTKNWLEKLVIGLNLCPFAKLPFNQNRIRYVVESGDKEALMQTFLSELALLTEKTDKEVETTLIIHPNVLTDFYDYLDFVAEADEQIDDSGLRGTIQVASFHPDYQFAGTNPEDVENYTNRSPFPMLHLIREDSIEKALEHYPDPEMIPERNIETMKRLGLEGVQQILKPDC